MSKAKLTYFLFYTQTDEAEKMQELKEQMEDSNRMYEFVTISELVGLQFNES